MLVHRWWILNDDCVSRCRRLLQFMWTGVLGLGTGASSGIITTNQWNCGPEWYRLQYNNKTKIVAELRWRKIVFFLPFNFPSFFLVYVAAPELQCPEYLLHCIPQNHLPSNRDRENHQWIAHQMSLHFNNFNEFYDFRRPTKKNPFHVQPQSNRQLKTSGSVPKIGLRMK